MTRHFKYLDLNHSIGDNNCRVCWINYPIICDNCGGLIHSEFEDYIDEDEGFSLSRECENCHDQYKIND